MSARDDARKQILEALATMPDEAFMWLVLATRQRAQPQGALTQVWPDGIGGFTQQSRDAITRVRVAAESFVEATN